MQRDDNKPRPWRLDPRYAHRSKAVDLLPDFHWTSTRPYIDRQGVNAAGDIWFIVQNWGSNKLFQAPRPQAYTSLPPLVFWNAYVEIQWRTREIRAKLATIAVNSDDEATWCVTDWLYLKTLAQRDKRKTLFDALTEATAQTLQCHFIESQGHTRERADSFFMRGENGFVAYDYDDIFDVDTGFHGL